MGAVEAFTRYEFFDMSFEMETKSYFSTTGKPYRCRARAAIGLKATSRWKATEKEAVVEAAERLWPKIARQG